MSIEATEDAYGVKLPKNKEILVKVDADTSEYMPTGLVSATKYDVFIWATTKPDPNGNGGGDGEVAFLVFNTLPFCESNSLYWYGRFCLFLV
ncbi:unnamed protein product [Protopolystoma xenopodis]|uniref:Uncharacterized protein n=1 Tax=Protopolystoma xenopodis TaxID=117903 RepID=A0A448WP12_9PLAT|nr:unnamed protein product [Protopolystoma xenopodis]